MNKMAKYVKSLVLLNENDIKNKIPAKARVELTAAGLKAFDIKKFENLREKLSHSKGPSKGRIFVFTMPSYSAPLWSLAILDSFFVRTSKRTSSTSSGKSMTMAQYLKGIKDKGYKVVKNPSGSITITKIKAAVKK
jgi:hypothetical protein